MQPEHIAMMTQPFTLSPRSKDDFWDVVEDCLRNFHQLTKPDAEQRARGLRRRIENPPPDISSDIFYHAEPFDVACDLADRELDLERNQAEYNSILERHKW
jgi:hypothetical protein